MTAISKNVYFDVLDDIVNKYNNTVHRTIKMRPIDVTDDVVSDLNGELITGSFYKKGLLKASQGKFRIEKVLKIKGDKLYVKWKGYDNSFNSWIDKKEIV